MLQKTIVAEPLSPSPEVGLELLAFCDGLLRYCRRRSVGSHYGHPPKLEKPALPQDAIRCCSHVTAEKW